MPEFIDKTSEGVRLQDRQEVCRPRRFKVLLHNDHYTTMDFVVDILETIFHKPHQQAMEIMLDVHKNGMGVAGVYVKAIAETKIMKVQALAKEHGFPLRCSMRPE